jgi:hypothetical protein
MRTKLLVSVLILVSFFSCQKKPVSEIPPVHKQAPDGLLQELAWNGVKQIKEQLASRELPLRLQIIRVSNDAGIPDQAVGYFRSLLEYQIRQAGGVISQNGYPLTASLIKRKSNSTDVLDFEFQATSGGSAIVQGKSTILFDNQLANVLAYFKPKQPEATETDPHAHHHEVDIPTPVARLASPALDVAQICESGKDYCNVAVLYGGSIEFVDWKNGERQMKSFPPDAISSIRSRAPSGKIISGPSVYTILSNNLTAPLFYDSQWNNPVTSTPPSYLPLPELGFNSYTLKNGRFYDFELIESKGLAVIEISHRLSVAAAGTLATSDQMVGDSLALNLPAIYTTAPVLFNQKDAVMKFIYDGAGLFLQSKKESEGTILDLSITDLNQDSKSELLVTVQREDGIYIEVWETF